jgi:8-oxo-dGTP diphosphatase
MILTMSLQEIIQEAKQKGARLGICALVVRQGLQGAEVLLIQRSDHDTSPGVWELPGGGVDDGEDVVDALRRELQEEVGLVDLPEQGYVCTFGFDNIETGKIRRKLCFQFGYAGEPIILSPDHIAYKFINAEQARGLSVEGTQIPYELFRDHADVLNLFFEKHPED